MGNALFDDHYDHLGVFQFMWSAGLISDQTYKLLNLACDFQSFVHASNSCDLILDIADKELGNIDPYSIFTPSCHGNGSQSNQLRKRMHVSIHTELDVIFSRTWRTFPLKWCMAVNVYAYLSRNRICYNFRIILFFQTEVQINGIYLHIYCQIL